MRHKVNYSDFLYVLLVFYTLKQMRKLTVYYIKHTTKFWDGSTLKLSRSSWSRIPAEAFCHHCLSFHGKVCRCFSSEQVSVYWRPYISIIIRRSFLFLPNRVEAAANACYEQVPKIQLIKLVRNWRVCQVLNSEAFWAACFKIWKKETFSNDLFYWCDLFYNKMS